jgi:hypothetical protein
MKYFYQVKLIFFSDSIRKTAPCLKPDVGVRYSPHLVVKNDDEYLGVTFINGNEGVFDKEIDAVAASLYEGVGYHKLVKGSEFLIMEGSHIVGEGIVKDVHKDNL